MELLIILLLIVLLAWTSQRWGADSRDTMHSCEWKRRTDYQPINHHL
jgi:hypothetical protein